MEIELFFADQIVPTGELFRAMQAGTIDAVQSDDDSMASPTEVGLFGGYFPFATRYSSMCRCCSSSTAWRDLGEEEYAKVGSAHLGRARTRATSTPRPDHQLAGRSDGLRLFTFPTAGRFLTQFGVVPVTLPWEDASRSRCRPASSTASPGPASPRTTRSAGPM
jgi:hypothetical protein